MKKKILILLFILNTLVLPIYYFSFLQGIVHIFFDQNAAGIGIIGGADGPTSIYVASRINWVPIVNFSLEILLGLCLLLSRSKK